MKHTDERHVWVITHTHTRLTHTVSECSRERVGHVLATSMQREFTTLSQGSLNRVRAKDAAARRLSQRSILISLQTVLALRLELTYLGRGDRETLHSQTHTPPPLHRRVTRRERPNEVVTEPMRACATANAISARVLRGILLYYHACRVCHRHGVWCATHQSRESAQRDFANVLTSIIQSAVGRSLRCGTLN